MKYEYLCRQWNLREKRSEYKNNLIAKEILLKYLEKIKETELPYQITSNAIDSLIYNYFYIKDSDNESKNNEILNLYNFNYSMSIHNAIYYLLATEREYVDCIDPLSWPGVEEINICDSKYSLNTILGNIEVYKASELFSSSSSEYIFNKKLMGQCYGRTYDFLKENRDYQAVLSYMPYFFYGGHYHAYLEKDGNILDIASNAFYSSKDSIDKIFCGEIIAKLSYSQVQKKFNILKKTTPNISSKPKLLTLALYYDRKNYQKK